MSRSSLVALLTAGLALTAPMTARAASLDALPRDGWVSWEVDSAAQGDGPCCYEIDRDGQRRGCRLSAGTSRLSTQQADSPRGEPGRLVIYAHRSGGATDGLHALAADCPVAIDGPVTAMAQVTAAESLAFLDAALDSDASLRREAVVMAIAHHADPEAPRRLVARAAPAQSKPVRRDALFWLAQLHPARGLGALRTAATSDPSREVRHHALFALSQADLPEARATLRALATDRGIEGEDRGQALFWLAQSEDPGARDAILSALGEGDGALLEQAVFALSQLDEGADEALIAVVEGDYPREARKRALFWLGQSGSEAAMGFLDRVFAAEPARKPR